MSAKADPGVDQAFGSGEKADRAPKGTRQNRDEGGVLFIFVAQLAVVKIVDEFYPQFTILSPAGWQSHRGLSKSAPRYSESRWNREDVCILRVQDAENNGRIGADNVGASRGESHGRQQRPMGLSWGIGTV